MRAAIALMIGVVCATVGAHAIAAESLPDACGLLSRAEIEHAIGGPATGFDHATTFREGSTSICQGSAGGATVTVRVSIESEQDEENERTIRQMMRSSGGKVETERAGAVTCTTTIPPESMMQYGFDSMCRVSEGGREAAVQASTRERKNMVPVADLRRLVILAGNRLSVGGH
ncbi:MAG TPA: hypothetical protein VMU41_01390 [Candidatus Binataceae bacterium]|nr:hypothetical protein [Candidatus Binataceae bacterium]